MIAAIKVRGSLDAPKRVKQNLQNMNLEKKNQLVIYENKESIKGMMNKAKDYITYGEIDEETVEKIEDKKDTELNPGDTVNLTPPSGGYKNTKRNVNQGGSLGKRQNLDQLIQKMV
ncbi:MAG: uL30 family ribosomal protein [Candidatus Nanohaloarchaea archaeon]